MSKTKEFKRANWHKFQEDLTNNIWQVVHDDTLNYLDSCGIHDDLFDNIDDFVEFSSKLMDEALKHFATHQLYPNLDPPNEKEK